MIFMMTVSAFNHKSNENAINEEGTPVDVTTVTSYLMDHLKLDKMGGVDYLAN